MIDPAERKETLYVMYMNRGYVPLYGAETTYTETKSLTRYLNARFLMF